MPHAGHCQLEQQQGKQQQLHTTPISHKDTVNLLPHEGHPALESRDYMVSDFLQSDKHHSMHPDLSKVPAALHIHIHLVTVDQSHFEVLYLTPTAAMCGLLTTS